MTFSNERRNAGLDIALLQAYRQGRLQFDLKIAEASNDKSDEVLSRLRTDALHQIAEFYFLLEAFNIKSVDEFDALLERHNAYISALLSDVSKMHRMGLTKERLLAAIFDGDTKPRVLRCWADSPGTIDQSSIAKLLVAVMSDETARKTVVACGLAGFLRRENSVFRVVLVRSAGVLETIYGECLREVRENFANAETTGKAIVNDVN